MAQPKQARAKHARPATTPSPRHTGAAGANASTAVRGGIAQLVTPSSELGAMVGAVYTDDLLDRIFSRFCIGK